MDTLSKLLDRLGDRTGLSDRQISEQLFRLSLGAVSHWRTGRALPDDEQARALARHLELDERHVTAIIHAERAKTPETRSMWRSIADKFAKAACVGVVAVGLSAAPTPSPASTASALCIMESRRRWLFALLPDLDADRLAP